MSIHDPDNHNNGGRTGGQYSLLRVGLGLALLFQFSTAWHATATDHGWTTEPMLLTGAALCLSLGLMLGWQDRFSALALVLVWGLMRVRHDYQVVSLDLPLVLLLLGHLLVSIGRPVPYGAWSMRGRVDPGAQWRMPAGLVDAVWLFMALQCLAVALLPSALNPRLEGVLLRWNVMSVSAMCLAIASLLGAYWQRSWRPALWVLLALALGLVLLIDGAGPRLPAFLLMLMFSFEPHWIKPQLAAEPEFVFYDGECGLCHRATRFLLAEDEGGRAFAMAPLQGPTFQNLVSAEERASLPDSIIVRTHAGKLLRNSSAIVHMLRALGGFWSLAGNALALVPRVLRDAGYRAVARVRKRIFATPKSLCPILPAHLGARFLP